MQERHRGTTRRRGKGLVPFGGLPLMGYVDQLYTSQRLFLPGFVTLRVPRLLASGCQRGAKSLPQCFEAQGCASTCPLVATSQKLSTNPVSLDAETRLSFVSAKVRVTLTHHCSFCHSRASYLLLAPRFCFSNSTFLYMGTNSCSTDYHLLKRISEFPRTAAWCYPS